MYLEKSKVQEKEVTSVERIYEQKGSPDLSKECQYKVSA